MLWTNSGMCKNITIRVLSIERTQFQFSYTPFTRSSKHRVSSPSQLHRVNGVLLSDGNEDRKINAVTEIWTLCGVYRPSLTKVVL